MESSVNVSQFQIESHKKQLKIIRWKLKMWMEQVNDINSIDKLNDIKESFLFNWIIQLRMIFTMQ